MRKIQNPRNCNTLNDFDKYLRAKGYSPRNTGGSHVVYNCSGKPSLSIPCHNVRANQSVSPGVKRNIVKLILGNEYYQKA